MFLSIQVLLWCVEPQGADKKYSLTKTVIDLVNSSIQAEIAFVSNVNFCEVAGQIAT